MLYRTLGQPSPNVGDGLYTTSTRNRNRHGPMEIREYSLVSYEQIPHQVVLPNV